MSSFARIDELLETLKSDLKAMRTQDVKLMKQLININETIQTLSKHRTPRPQRQRRSCGGPTLVSSLEFSRMATPLVRQQSAPSCKLPRIDSLGSNSSFEDMDMESSLEDVSEEPYSEAEDFLNASTRSLPVYSSMPRAASFCFMAPLPDENEEEEAEEKRYEGILMTNIKLWKTSNRERLGKVKLDEHGECSR